MIPYFRSIVHFLKERSITVASWALLIIWSDDNSMVELCSSNTYWYTPTVTAHAGAGTVGACVVALGFSAVRGRERDQVGVVKAGRL